MVAQTAITRLFRRKRPGIEFRSVHQSVLPCVLSLPRGNSIQRIWARLEIGFGLYSATAAICAYKRIPDAPRQRVLLLTTVLGVSFFTECRAKAQRISTHLMAPSSRLIAHPSAAVSNRASPRACRAKPLEVATVSPSSSGPSPSQAAVRAAPRPWEGLVALLAPPGPRNQWAVLVPVATPPSSRHPASRSSINNTRQGNSTPSSNRQHPSRPAGESH